MFSRLVPMVGLVLGLAIPLAHAQDPRGRKYKVPPESTHIEVQVLKDNNSKPVVSAAVVFHSRKDGRDEGNLEVKTNGEGVATIDVIPVGSTVDVQVIADGFATFAETYQVNEMSRTIQVRMSRPRAQISTYVDTHGQSAQRQAGVQEPIRKATPPVIETPQPTNHTSDPTAIAPGAVNDSPAKTTVPAEGVPVNTAPANIHPDNQYPVDPASAPKTPNQPASPTPPRSIGSTPLLGPDYEQSARTYRAHPPVNAYVAPSLVDGR